MRGIRTVQDLLARSRRDPFTHCWHWLRAMSHGKPAIHTYDHEFGDKRVMSGPRAVWNIAHGESPGARVIWRRCGHRDCVNPAHMQAMPDHASMFAAMTRQGRYKGARSDAQKEITLRMRMKLAQNITPMHVADEIRGMPKTVTGRAIAQQFGLSETTVSRIRLGRSRTGSLGDQI
jgi:hypothetical protein